MDILLLGVLAVLIILLISQNRKRKRESENLISSIAVGSAVILHSGIKGTVTAIHDDSDLEVETTPGTKLRVVKQAVRGIEAAKEK